MLALFWEAMHPVSTMTARKLGEAVDFRHFRRLLDIGGGSGAYDIELCKQYGTLRATVFDLPHVTAIAAGKIAEAGLTDRIETAGGSFFEQLPADHDVHLLSMILHDWDEAKNRALLRRSFEALPSGGAVVISELLVNDEKTGPAPAALMSLNMLIETEGRNYTSSEYSAWLEEAGFQHIEDGLVRRTCRERSRDRPQTITRKGGVEQAHRNRPIEAREAIHVADFSSSCVRDRGSYRASSVRGHG